MVYGNPTLIFEPAEELIFRDKLGHVTGVQLLIKNKNMEETYFKVKSTASKFYSVRPSWGSIKPHGQVKIIIQPHDDSDTSLDVIEKDNHRFMIQSAFVDSKHPKTAEEFWQTFDKVKIPVTTAKLRVRVQRVKAAVTILPKKEENSPVAATPKLSEEVNSGGIVGGEILDSKKNSQKMSFAPPPPKSSPQSSPEPFQRKFEHVPGPSYATGVNNIPIISSKWSVGKFVESNVADNKKSVFLGRNSLAMEESTSENVNGGGRAQSINAAAITTTPSEEKKVENNNIIPPPPPFPTQMAAKIDDDGFGSSEQSIKATSLATNEEVKSEILDNDSNNKNNNNKNENSPQEVSPSLPPRKTSQLSTTEPLQQNRLDSPAGPSIVNALHNMSLDSKWNVEKFVEPAMADRREFVSYGMLCGGGGGAGMMMANANLNYGRYIASVLDNLPKKGATGLKREIALLIAKYEQMAEEGEVQRCDGGGFAPIY